MAKSLVLLAGLCAIPSLASAILIPGSAYTGVAAGSFVAGTVLNLTATGTVDLTGSGGWITKADGSLLGTVTASGYGYANVGSSGYPTTNGGDGINHFAGGGANYDVFQSGTASYGQAGLLSTDTTNPNAVRFGALIGTFSAAPTRADWFLVGLGKTVVSPGGTLYLAVNDSFSPNNTGGYEVSVQAVPEPSSLFLAVPGLLILSRRRRARS